MSAQPPNLNIQVPADKQAGVYANELVVWHTNQDFTLDFLQTQPSEDPHQVNMLVVSRVKIPPTLVFEILKALNTNLDNYEMKFGEIKRPGEGGEQPTE